MLKDCGESGRRVFLDEKMSDGSTVHAVVRKVIDNPVTGMSAYALVILNISAAEEDKVDFDSIAQALSSDYIYLYYVDIETGRFVEYSHSGGGKGLSVERHGEDFFNESQRDIMVVIYEDDKDELVRTFTKENIMKNLEENGVFVLTYRLMIDGSPTFVNMKTVRMSGDDRHIIIGVNNVDAQMRQRETIERLREEQTTYARISALMGDFIAIYTVDPETG